MKIIKMPYLFFIGSLATLFLPLPLSLVPHQNRLSPHSPERLDSYNDAQTGILSILHHRIIQEPFNLIASLIFPLVHH